MKTYLIVLFFTMSAFAKDPFSGKIATCIGDGTKRESWRFIGLTSEYVKDFQIGASAFSQKGKYSFKKNVLTIQEYKPNSKELEPARKFTLKATMTEDGFEYLWKAPNGTETPYTCTWKK
jgi:hypothetical protein